MREKHTTRVEWGTQPGFFYAIQLAPDLDLGRIKLGWAGDVPKRLRGHQISAPTAELWGSWPCDRGFEAAAIAHVSPLASARLSAESFEFPDLAALRRSLDDFFVSLSPDSPLRVRGTLIEVRLVSGDMALSVSQPSGRSSARQFMSRPREWRIAQPGAMEFEVIIEGAEHTNQIRDYLERRLWGPLSEYIIGDGVRRGRAGGRKFRVRFEWAE